MTNDEYRQLYDEFTEGKKELINKFYKINSEVNQTISLPEMFSDRWKVYTPQKSIISDGIYLTARIQTGGFIYTMLNQFKDGEWQGRCLDGGYTIAYQEITKEEFKELIIKNL
jgi:hypothetical protein